MPKDLIRSQLGGFQVRLWNSRTKDFSNKFDLRSALAEANSDSTTRVIVLRGAERAFCSGDDLKDFDQQTGNEQQVRAYIELFQEITREIMHGDKIVIGAIHGWVAERRKRPDFRALEPGLLWLRRNGGRGGGAGSLKRTGL